MKCKLKKDLEYVVWNGSRESKDKIAEWFSKNEEYEGVCECASGALEIEFMFENFVIIPYGFYVINDDLIGRSIISKEDFKNNFEVIND